MFSKYMHYIFFFGFDPIEVNLFLSGVQNN